MNDSEFTLPPRFALPGVDLNEYFGVWAVHGSTMRAVVNQLQGFNVQQLSSSPQVRAAATAFSSARSDYNISSEGIAMLQVAGQTMKGFSCFGGTSTVLLRSLLRSARTNPEVLGAMLVMDTPGGTVRGNSDLAQSVAEFAAVKPIFAYIEDMCASAGVQTASHATKRFANQNEALYGSMGTFQILTDQSGLADKLGVKVHVIRAGDFKGMGEPGTAISADQIAEVQRVVTALNEGYLQSIAAGTKLPLAKVRAAADGRIIIASEARALGLIDGIQSFDRTYEQLVAATRSTKTSPPVAGPSNYAPAPTLSTTTRQQETTTVSEQPTSEQIIGAFSKAVELECETNGGNRQRAIAAVARRDPELHQAYLDCTNRQSAPALSAEERESAINRWNAAMERELQKSGGDRVKALAAARRRDPQLHAAFIQATNSQYKVF